MNASKIKNSFVDAFLFVNSDLLQTKKSSHHLSTVNNFECLQGLERNKDDLQTTDKRMLRFSFGKKKFKKGEEQGSTGEPGNLQDPNDNSMLDMLTGYSSIQIRILLLLLLLLLLWS